MKKTFDKIKLWQLHTLCNILAETQVRHLSNIRRRYLENGLAFDETIALLEDLKILRNNSDELFLRKPFSVSHNSLDEFKRKFLPVLFSARGDVAKQLNNFLSNFQTEADKIFFKATELQKVKFSDIRSLLLELDFISASADNTTYFVNPLYTDLFVKQFSLRKLSPETLKKEQAENDAIGLLAEQAVIQYEINRLKNMSLKPNEIEHISEENANAGFDIKSFENYLDENSQRIKRYIEVKAISLKDYKFYWSKNEISISKFFGERYFLYLLPVVANNTFDFEKLLIVNNPFKNIYLNEIKWKREEECISFSTIIPN